MNAADNPQIEVLLSASARDERTLHLPVDDEIFGFHAQQAVEKLWKALITAHGQEYRFTHNLELLAAQLRALDEHVPTLPVGLEELSGYAVAARYEEGAPFNVRQRNELRQAIAALRVHVQSRAQQLRSVQKDE